MYNIGRSIVAQTRMPDRRPARNTFDRRYTMSSLVALSISIGVLGGVATALSLGPLSGIVYIWVAFIAWACYFAIGGDQKVLRRSTPNTPLSLIHISEPTRPY